MTNTDKQVEEIYNRVTKNLIPLRHSFINRFVYREELSETVESQVKVLDTICKLIGEQINEDNAYLIKYKKLTMGDYEIQILKRSLFENEVKR